MSVLYLSIAWRSLAGFQVGSNNTTTLAPTKLRPSPPALEEPEKGILKEQKHNCCPLIQLCQVSVTKSIQYYINIIKIRRLQHKHAKTKIAMEYHFSTILEYPLKKLTIKAHISRLCWFFSFFGYSNTMLYDFPNMHSKNSKNSPAK